MKTDVLGAVGWDDDPALRTVSFAPLESAATADACVIGLGGSGLAAVHDLTERGLSVIGVDAGRIAAGAAGRNGGFLLAGPADAVHTYADTWGSDAALDIYRRTQLEIDALADALGPDIIRRSGSIRLAGLVGSSSADTTSESSPLMTSDAQAAAEEAELADCALQEAWMRDHGLPVERYDGPLGSGLYFAGDAAMNPVRRAMGLAAQYGRTARLHEYTSVTRIETGTVHTDRAVISVGLIIVAVDGLLEILLPQLEGHVRTGRLQMAATAPITSDVLPCPVYSRFGYDYLQQGLDGRLCAGGGRDVFMEQEWTIDMDPSAPVQEWIDLLLARAGGDTIAPVTHRWAAPVGFTDDGRPLVTQVDEGIVACGGYNGTGNLVGPIAARDAIALALDGATPGSYFNTLT